MFVFCVEPFKAGDKIISPRTTMLSQILFIKIEVLLGRRPIKIYESLREVCGDPKLDRRKISFWYQRFCLGQDSIKDKERSDRLRTSTDNTSEEIIAIISEEDTRMICEEIAMESRAPKLSIHRVLSEALKKKRQLPATWHIANSYRLLSPIISKKYCLTPLILLNSMSSQSCNCRCVAKDFSLRDSASSRDPNVSDSLIPVDS